MYKYIEIRTSAYYHLNCSNIVRSTKEHISAKHEDGNKEEEKHEEGEEMEMEKKNGGVSRALERGQGDHFDISGHGIGDLGSVGSRGVGRAS